MLTFIIKVLRKIEWYLVRINNSAQQSIIGKSNIQSERVKPWFEANGDKEHRLNYSLNAQSLVFDLGGFEGDWASAIYCKYGASVFIFEPNYEYVSILKKKFEFNSCIKIFPFGLSSNNVETKLSVEGNASSIFKKTDKMIDIELINAETFFSENNVRFINLMKINIEGGEYDLLDKLIETGLSKRIENIQVQFHDFVPEALTRMRDIQAKLAITHTLTYQYEFVWENWTLKK